MIHSSLATPDAEKQEAARTYQALLVDDNLDLLEIAAALFKACGYEVITADNGVEALEILRRTPDIGLIFTDIMMPGISGIRLGIEARKVIPGIKVILVSGSASVATSARDGCIHDFDFLKKPYRFSDVLALLAKTD